MSESPQFSRSQAIFRLPVDRLPAGMVLHDGSRSEIELFLPLGDTVVELLTRLEAFMPVMRDGERVTLVARGAIACLAVADVDDPAAAGMPIDHQRVQVQLRSGLALDGELRWVAPNGRQRTADHLNDGAPTFELYAGGIVHHVVKAHVAAVEER